MVLQNHILRFSLGDTIVTARTRLGPLTSLLQPSFRVFVCSIGTLSVAFRLSRKESPSVYTPPTRAAIYHAGSRRPLGDIVTLRFRAGNIASRVYYGPL